MCLAPGLRVTLLRSETLRVRVLARDAMVARVLAGSLFLWQSLFCSFHKQERTE